MFSSLFDIVNRSGGLRSFGKFLADWNYFHVWENYFHVWESGCLYLLEVLWAHYQNNGCTENFRKWVLIFAKNGKWILTISERLGSDKWDFWQFGVRGSKVEVLNICWISKFWELDCFKWNFNKRVLICRVPKSRVYHNFSAIDNGFKRNLEPGF